MSRSRLRVLLPLVLVACVLPGCGGGSSDDDNGAATPSTPSASTPTSTATSTTPPTTSTTGGSTTSVPKPSIGKSISAAPQPGIGHGVQTGMGDQGSAFFAAPAFRALGIKRARLFASYDTTKVRFDRDATDQWLAAAKDAGIQALVAFNHSRVGGKTTHLPSVSEFRTAFAGFHRRYPAVKLYTPWNEPNNQTQPTADNPQRAAQFANVIHAACPQCTVVAGDVQDQAGSVAWIRKYRAALYFTPKVWGVHNYSDVNRFRTTGLDKLEKVMPGDIWLTETGGVAAFGRAFRFDLERQARAFNYLFVTARAEPRVKRVYLYNWTGAAKGARFDAGLVNPDGTPRPAYAVVKAALTG